MLATGSLNTTAYTDQHRCKIHRNELSGDLILQIKATSAAQKSTFLNFPDQRGHVLLQFFMQLLLQYGKTTFNHIASAKTYQTLPKIYLLVIPVT